MLRKMLTKMLQLGAHLRGLGCWWQQSLVAFSHGDVLHLAGPHWSSLVPKDPAELRKQSVPAGAKGEGGRGGVWHFWAEHKATARLLLIENPDGPFTAQGEASCGNWGLFPPDYVPAPSTAPGHSSPALTCSAVREATAKKQENQEFWEEASEDARMGRYGGEGSERVLAWLWGSSGFSLTSEPSPERWVGASPSGTCRVLTTPAVQVR